jgi:hypothetical protein
MGNCAFSDLIAWPFIRLLQKWTVGSKQKKCRTKVIRNKVMQQSEEWTKPLKNSAKKKLSEDAVFRQMQSLDSPDSRQLASGSWQHKVDSGKVVASSIYVQYSRQLMASDSRQVMASNSRQVMASDSRQVMASDSWQLTFYMTAKKIESTQQIADWE